MKLYFIIYSIVLLIVSFCFIGGGYLAIYGYILMPLCIITGTIVYRKYSSIVWFSSLAILLYIFLLYVFVTSFDFNITYSLFVRLSPILFFKLYMNVILSNNQLVPIAKKMVYLWIGVYIFFCYKSFIFLQENPMGLREIISIAKDNTVAIGGGFALPYALCFFLPFVVGKFKQGVNFSVFEYIYFCIFLLIGILLVAKSLYMTALIILFVGCLYALSKERSLSQQIVFWCVVFLLMFGFYHYIPVLLELISGNETTVLLRRFNDIDILLQGDNLSNAGDFYARLQLSLSSLLVFFDNPVMGVGWQVAYDSFEMEKLGVGSHAQWFDIFAIYGFFSILIILFFIKSSSNVFVKMKNNLSLLLFVLTGFLNPVFSYSMLFVTFFFGSID